MSLSKFILTVLCIACVFASQRSYGQSFKLTLSPGHEKKINAIQSGHKRMVKYYKYFRKDSANFRKRQAKKAKQSWDSLARVDNSNHKLTRILDKKGIKGEQQIAYAERLQKEFKEYSAILKDSTSSDSAKLEAKNRLKSISKDKINAQLARLGHPYMQQYTEVANLKKEMTSWWKIMRDSSSSDSLKSVAKANVKEIAIKIAGKDPKFQGVMEHYHQLGKAPDWKSLSKDFPGIDSLEDVFDSSTDKLLDGAETVATQSLTRIGNLREINKQAGEINKLKEGYSQMMKPDDLKATGIDKAKSMGTDYFASHADKLTAAQSKVSGLMNKYRSFTNANDLSNAVKKTSLEGKSFKERIVLGGNFSIVSTKPISVDFAPLIGYRWNSKFYTGVSATYRQTFADSLKYSRYISAKNSSLRLFVNYDLIKNFFGYAEAERAGSKAKTNEAQSLKWTNNYFVGLGRKMLVHPKLYMTITALYNLNSQRQNITYPNRFQLRLGFQTSDLAFRKKNVYYDR